jgi:hypothetical protein
MVSRDIKQAPFVSHEKFVSLHTSQKHLSLLGGDKDEVSVNSAVNGGFINALTRIFEKQDLTHQKL